MKKNCFLLVVLTALSFFTLPNQIYSQSRDGSVKRVFDKTQVDSCPGAGNFFVDPATAQKMISDFIKIYVRKNPAAPIYALNQLGWVDSNVVYAMANLLALNSTIDGFRVYFCAALTPDPASFPNQIYQNKVSLIMVPTIPVGGNHQDAWGTDIPLTIPYEISNVYINMKEADATLLTEKFFTVYRRERDIRDYNSALIKNLSRSVWFCRDLIDNVKDYMKKYNSDGLRIYPAAYSEMSSNRPSQMYPDQSTFVLVPTKFIVVGREDDWSVSKNLKLNKEDFNAYNHGELCPNSCP